MMTAAQLMSLTKQFKTNETVVYREYLQVLMLKAIYDDPLGKAIFFKGGTAIHLLFGAPRFSEDLDFTVTAGEDDFLKSLQGAVKHVGEQEEIVFKKRETIAGRRWLVTAQPASLRFPIYLTLDFFFRERVLHPQKSPFQTVFPVVFTSYVHHLSMGEMLAEKIRAIMTRRKGRDLYDLWYLVSRGATMNQTDVKEKLSYYQLDHTSATVVLARIASFPREAFIKDLRPFVPIPERAKLSEFYDYVQAHLATTLA